MKYFKFTYIFLIIISNTSFGKEFDKLFTVYEPIIDSSNIEKSINTAFNKMIFRLSGDPSPSNIWKIINAGNNRKDFITSYSIENQNGIAHLKVLLRNSCRRLVFFFGRVLGRVLGRFLTPPAPRVVL